MLWPPMAMPKAMPRLRLRSFFYIMRPVFDLYAVHDKPIKYPCK